MKVHRTFLVCLPCLLAVPLLAQPQIGGGTCSSSTLSGSYSLTLTGRDVSSSVGFSNALQGIGLATFDGLNKVTFSLTNNTNKAFGIAQTLSGTYSLQSNCIGVVNITTGDMANFTLESYNEGKAYLITGQDGIYSFSGSGNTSPATCTAGVPPGAYSFSANGFTLASGTITGANFMSGLIQINGTSAITANWFVTANGASNATTASGTFTATGCTATANVTDSSGNAYVLLFTITAANGSGFLMSGSNAQMMFSGTGRSQGTPGTCTAATLNGVHPLVINGRDILPAAVLSKTFAGVGTATFDGAGGVTINLTTNTNQAQGVTQKLSGTYSLPSNCVGSLNITSGDTASFTLIAYNQGRTFSITGQDATYSFTGTGASQPDTCLTSTLSGVYAFSGNGFALTSTTISGVNSISGLLQFDGAGAITGNWSVATNGTATSDTITGHYSVTPSCLASASVTDPNGTAYTLTFAATTVDGANFSILGASPQNLFAGNGHSTFTNPGLAVANAAGVSGGTPPGSLFSIYGSGLSTGQAQPANVPLPTTLASASVTVNGELAPLTYVDKTQINAQMPLDIQSGEATVVVKNGSVVSNSVAVTVPASAVPGILTYGANHAVAQNFPSYSLNSPSGAAKVGDVVIVYLMGGGPVQGGSSLITGHATPGASFPVTAAYSATVAGVAATVDFIGLSPGFVGLYQANVVIPKVAAGERNLVITIAGTASNAALISVN